VSWRWSRDRRSPATRFLVVSRDFCREFHASLGACGT